MQWDEKGDGLDVIDVTDIQNDNAVPKDEVVSVQENASIAEQAPKQLTESPTQI